jgi:iron-sulfur cluster assembly accessory protein
MPNDTATVLEVTDKASRKIRQLSDKEGREQALLRVRVTAGGCSGFKYELEFAEAVAGDDHVIVGSDDVRVIVDPTSAPILQGSTLEFDDALVGGGLRVLNPQAVDECACGESFSI